MGLNGDGSKLFLSCGNNIWNYQPGLPDNSNLVPGQNFQAKKDITVAWAWGVITNKLVRNDRAINDHDPTSQMRVRHIMDNYHFIPQGIGFNVAVNTADGSIAWQA